VDENAFIGGDGSAFLKSDTKRERSEKIKGIEEKEKGEERERDKAKAQRNEKEREKENLSKG